MTEVSDRHLDDLAELRKRLAAFRGELKQPSKNKSVRVTPKDPANKPYTFFYADLSACQEAVDGLLSKHGIALIGSIEEIDGREFNPPQIRVSTRIAFGVAEESCTISAVKPAKIQDVGSAITYMRRYTLCTLLGLAADDDDDGNAVDGNAATPADKSPAKKPTTPPAKAAEAPPSDRTAAIREQAKAKAADPAGQVAKARGAVVALVERITHPHHVLVGQGGVECAVEAAVDLIASKKREIVPEDPAPGDWFNLEAYLKDAASDDKRLKALLTLTKSCFAGLED